MTVLILATITLDAGACTEAAPLAAPPAGWRRLGVDSCVQAREAINGFNARDTATMLRPLIGERGPRA